MLNPELLLLSPLLSLVLNPLEEPVGFVAPLMVDVPEFADVFDPRTLVGDVPFGIPESVHALRDTAKATALTNARGSVNTFLARSAGTPIGSGSEFGLAGSGRGKGAGSGTGVGIGSG